MSLSVALLLYCMAGLSVSPHTPDGVAGTAVPDPSVSVADADADAIIIVQSLKDKERAMFRENTRALKTATFISDISKRTTSAVTQ